MHIGAGDYERFVVGPSDGFTMARHKKAALVEAAQVGWCSSTTSDFVPGIVAMPTPGHTPGHLAFAIRDRGERLMILGDSMYCPAQLTDMDLAAMHDVDPALARRSRELIAREVELHATTAVGCHFPGLRAARVIGGEVVSA